MDTKEFTKHLLDHHKLDVKYGNANYQRVDKNDSTTLEVLITNY